MLADEITRSAIAATEPIIRPYIRRTPVVTVDGRDLDLDGTVTFKLEFLQHAGSFKARGAFTNLLLREIPDAGVVAASGGNHGVAVAYAAMRVGVPATIFVPEISSPAKLIRIRDCGAKLVVTGDRYDDALRASRQWEADSGAVPIHAFDARETLLGAGTLGLELEQQAPDATAVFAPVGGGGLIGGTAAWFAPAGAHAAAPASAHAGAGATRIIGVEPEGAPTLTRARAAGEPVDAPAEGIAADSLAPKRIGVLPFAITQQYVDEVVLVTDDQIRAAQRLLWERLRIVAEPGGAAALAGLRARPDLGRGHPAVIVSGANTTAVNFDL